MLVVGEGLLCSATAEPEPSGKMWCETATTAGKKARACYHAPGITLIELRATKPAKDTHGRTAARVVVALRLIPFREHYCTHGAEYHTGRRFKDRLYPRPEWHITCCLVYIHTGTYTRPSSIDILAMYRPRQQHTTLNLHRCLTCMFMQIVFLCPN